MTLSHLEGLPAIVSIFDIIFQIGVAALIFPVIPHEDNVMKRTWSTSWYWYSHVVIWLKKLRNADNRQLYMLRLRVRRNVEILIVSIFKTGRSHFL